MKKITLSLRAKIIAAFVILSTVLSGGLSVFNYLNLKDQLFQDMRKKIANVAFLGAQMIDKSAFAQLTNQIKAQKENNHEISTKIESSTAYLKVHDQLNTIRDSNPELIRFIYTFVPGLDENTAYYLVDANTLHLLKRATKGLRTEEIARFNDPWDIKAFPAARDVIKSRLVTIEQDFTYDKEMQLHLLSGYAPIVDEANGRTLGFIALDISAKDADRLLADSVRNSLYVTVIIVLVSFLISIYVGRVLTGTIVALDQIVNRFAENDFSARARISSHDEVGRLGYSLNQMATLIEESRVRLNALLTAYGRFVPQDYIKLLGKTDIVELKLGDYSQKQMTVLFTDIRGFTSLSEKMSPYENFAFINSFLKRMGPIVRQHDGIIDKYIGDAIMALFNDQPEGAIVTAVDMFEELQRYNEHRISRAFEPIDMGIGIHTGNIMVGTVGEQERMDGTVIGDSVNLASRLESLTKMYGAHIIVSETTIRLLQNRSKFQTRFLDKVIVKGKTEPIPILEILNGKSDALTRFKLETREKFETAAHAFHDGNADEALALFLELESIGIADAALRLYLERCIARKEGKKIPGVDDEYKKKA